MKDKRIIQVALNNSLTNLEGKIDLESLHNTKRAKEALEDLDKSVSSLELYNNIGGNWLGTAREWIQCKFKNGSDVTWGSQDMLKGRSLVVQDIELLAANIAASAINEYKGLR